jgi:hypothetical protein
MASAGADPALVQDALFDAEEHLQAEMAAGGQFTDVAQAYGSPEEVAAAYLGIVPAREMAAAMVAPYPGTAPQGTGTPVVHVAAPAEAVPAAAKDAGGPVEQGAPVGPSGTEIRGSAAVAPEGIPVAGTGAGSGTGPEPGRVFCPVCGTPANVGQVFCRQCGARLPQLQQEGEPLPGGLRAFGQQPYPVGVQTGMAAAAAGGASLAPKTVWQEIFGVFADSRVWLSLVYMIVSLGLGILYFTVVVTGISTAGGMIVLIVGIPLLFLVIGMVRGLSLFEGRVVEVLLGTRMPRRLRALPPNLGFFERLWFWLKDGRTWLSMLYMVLMLPLGIAYFTIAVVGLTVSLSMISSPVWVWFGDWTDHTFILNGEVHDWWFPAWTVPLAFIVGCILLVGFMHLVKWIGRGHAAFAKAMLVRLK